MRQPPTVFTLLFSVPLILGVEQALPLLFSLSCKEKLSHYQEFLRIISNSNEISTDWQMRNINTL